MGEKSPLPFLKKQAQLKPVTLTGLNTSHQKASLPFI